MTGFFVTRPCWKRVLAVLLALIVVSSFSITAATPPANDLCNGAEVIPGAGPFPYLSTVTVVTDATTNGDPAHVFPTNCFLGTVGRSVWYRFTPATNGFYVLSLNDTASTVEDTMMAIYASPGGCAGPLQLFDCNDDSGFTQSAIATNLTANTTYYIIAWVVTTNRPAPGEAAVQLKVSKTDVPGSDLCAGAHVIPPAGPFPYLTPVTDTILATTNSDPPATDCPVAPDLSLHRSIWFRFVPANGGTYSFSTCPNTATRPFDTLLGVYRSSSGCGGTLTKVACGNDSFVFYAAASATLTAGATYFIVVWDLEDVSPGYTDVQLAVQRTEAPTVTTLAASQVTSSSAVVRGSATPNGVGAISYFEWGTTTNYGSRTTSQPVNSNLFNVMLSRTIAGLSSNTLYHFRAVAGNPQGTNYGVDRTFIWSGTRPHIDSIREQLDRSYRLVLTGNTGQLYTVQATLSLTNWSDLGPATDLGNGIFEFFDLEAPDYPRSFYRVRVP